MINKKLVSYLKEDKKYVYLQVLMQWLALLSQIIIVAIMANKFRTKVNKNFLIRNNFRVNTRLSIITKT